MGFDCQVLFPATHDTGSAFLAVPAKENGVYLSSGTWSLLGTELPEPITTLESLARNFTNEGGYQYRFRYLKNIMGCGCSSPSAGRQGRASPSTPWSRPPGKRLPSPPRWMWATAASLAPENMGEAVRDACRETGQSVPQTLGELAACVYHSLAHSYAKAYRSSPPSPAGSTPP